MKKAAYLAALIYILGLVRELTFCDNGIYEQPGIGL